MDQRHKMALERFANAARPLLFLDTPGIGEATWKALLAKGWIEPTDDSDLKWWMRPHQITAEGRAALDNRTP